MKILCITSSSHGHIDFGGGGFVAVAQILKGRGHQVKWLTFGDQIERLNKHGCIAEVHDAIKGLRLDPFFSVADINENELKHQFKLDSLKKFQTQLIKENPDLILIDRLLVYAGLVAAELEIPYMAVGTPGGYWDFEKNKQVSNVLSVDDPVGRFCDVGELLKDDLAWVKGEINSFWLKSPLLNICFMSRDFYPLAIKQEIACANVYHNQTSSSVERDKRVGISFGNSGNPKKLLSLLEYAVELELIPLPIEVFIGTNEILYKELCVKYSTDQISLHKWVDFGSYFRNLSCLIFLGGIGTVWNCMDNGLPMIIIPGGVGDQLFNAERVQALGAGICLQEDSMNQGDIYAVITQCLQNDKCINRNYELRNSNNYTDTLDSLCQRIESI